MWNAPCARLKNCWAVDKPVHARGFAGLLSRMQEQRKSEPTTEQLPRIDRAGARRLIDSAGPDVGCDGGQQWSRAARSWFIKTSSWHAIVLYGAVLAGVMTASLEGPQHAWSSGGLLRSPPDSGAGGKEFTMMKKMSAVGIAAVMIASQTMAGGAVQWRVEDGGNGHWYQCLRTTGSGEVWNVSHAAANALGGHLATLTSQQENSWVYELSVAQNAWSGRNGPLLGGYKLPDNSFRWVTDEPWSYTSWLPGEPSSGLWEPYLMLLGPQGTSSSGATWNDTDAINPPDNSGIPTYTYIVEWEADCNNDGIVDYGQCQDGTLPDYNGNNVPDCCDRGEACVVGNYPVQWRAEYGGNGHWYEIQQLPTRPTCVEAESMAIQSGARPIALETLAENDFFRLLRCSQVNQHLSGWQDLRRVSDQWTWGSGEPFVFQSWSAGQPDSGDTATIDWAGPNGQCETLTWGDENCTVANLPAALFLEWSADCNNDGIVDYGQIRIGQLADTNNNGVSDTCECIGDIDVDGTIDGSDLGVLLAYWGPTTSAAASIACDLNVDGVVNGSDLGILLAYWGPCSN